MKFSVILFLRVIIILDMYDSHSVFETVLGTSIMSLMTDVSIISCENMMGFSDNVIDTLQHFRLVVCGLMFSHALLTISYKCTFHSTPTTLLPRAVIYRQLVNIVRDSF